MATFNLSREQAIKLLQRDFIHVLQKLDEDVPTQGAQTVDEYNTALLRAMIRALQRLDKGEGRPATGAPMSLGGGRHIGADPMEDYLRRFGEPR